MVILHLGLQSQACFQISAEPLGVGGGVRLRQGLRWKGGAEVGVEPRQKGTVSGKWMQGLSILKLCGSELGQVFFSPNF